VIDLMEALRKSMQAPEARQPVTEEKKPPQRATAQKKRKTG
jgi:hypothetical protein